jgi:hypothetical protein
VSVTSPHSPSHKHCPPTVCLYFFLSKTVAYCSKDCQRNHWKAGHKQICKQICKEKEISIVLEKPNESPYGNSINFKTGVISKGTYRKPSHVAVDEKFFVKVQGGPDAMPLLLYDQSRECEFHYSTGLRGFCEMLDKIRADPSANGRKTFMMASFDSSGHCKVYPGQTGTKKW